ncbi:ankyrin repeat domain-containing protein [Microvirga lotononidis]|uniref:Ankyrin repeat-containing protein n=1 Tax=Microvirga lotononidis TaxID=864069 RepID=I4Z0R5_9HYPH|nr:ankyrin repeat domain-containing protein [Microvirga lotononidis]EIM29807.1 ankyrin repeat-containing protein [Microvirga lotononidis]WQO31102.1 ankyrin repeat domain-containing protein [Microvirga lotononidis]
MANPLTLVGLLVILGLPWGAASAQTPPTQVELSVYRGLHAAAAQGSDEDIRRLAQAGADLNTRDGNGRTPLHVAAFQGHGAAARTLITVGVDPSLLDNQRYDAVTIAAVRDDVPTLKALLAAGASAKLITSVYDGTALIAAAHLGHDGIVRELIRAGAPLDHVNNLGWTALIEAVILGDGGPRHTQTVRALLEAGADARIPDRNGATPLQLAHARGYGGMVSLLRESSDR